MKIRNLLLSVLAALGVFFGTRDAAATITFPREVFDRLDYGIYWFGPGEKYQKASAKQSSPYFDPKKPTLLYVHGWQRGSTKKLGREAFNYGDSGAPDAYLAQFWLEMGWNVGVMYWNQFADEEQVADAEAKIWSTNGPQHMRWMNASGSYSEGPNKTAGQLFYESYKEAMAGYQGDTVRIAGHSLGNQMAIAVTKLISDGIAAGEVPERLLPRRVALLDPVYIGGERDFLNGAWTGELARGYVSQLRAKGVRFEAYRSSILGSVPASDRNEELMRMVALTDYKPVYFSPLALVERHCAAVWTYLWSIAFSPPRIKDAPERGLSASAPDYAVTAWEGSDRRLVHDMGMWTKTPEDDVLVASPK